RDQLATWAGQPDVDGAGREPGVHGSLVRSVDPVVGRSPAVRRLRGDADERRRQALEWADELGRRQGRECGIEVRRATRALPPGARPRSDPRFVADDDGLDRARADTL